MLDRFIQPLVRLLGERVIAVIGTLSVLLAVVWTVYSFLWQSTDVQQNLLYEAKLKACIEVSETVATIATGTDQQVLHDAKSLFWRYYYGPLVIFEDANLETAMKDFGDVLAAQGAGGDPASLRPHSLRVSAACHDLVGSGLFSQFWVRLFPILKRGRYK